VPVPGKSGQTKRRRADGPEDGSVRVVQSNWYCKHIGITFVTCNELQKIICSDLTWHAYTAHFTYKKYYIKALTYSFSALTLLVGWQEGHSACKKAEWWDVGVVVCMGCRLAYI